MLQNFSGQNLRGRSFIHQNLAESDFSFADIRGVDFTGANLARTNFRGSRSGLKRSWTFLLGFSAIVTTVLLGLFAFLILYLLQTPINYENSGAYPEVGSIYSYLIIGVVLVAVFVLTVFLDLIVAVGVATLIGLILGSWGWVVTKTPLAISGGLTAAVTGVGIVCVAIVIAIVGVILGNRRVWGAMIWLSSLAIIGPIFGFEKNSFGVVISSIIVSEIGVIVSSYVGWKALAGDARYAFIRNFAIAFSSLGGTSFYNADLTNADFFQATLKCANFRNANLTHTNFHQSTKLDRARVGNTILSDAAVRDLLVTHRGQNRSYSGCNLQGANLENADLSDANLTAAELGNATLSGAWLERSNLAKVRALGTNFRGANLTAACLEAWNIDSTTQLEGVVCDYVYLRDRQRERRPSDGEFQAGEFTKLFRVALDTVDLIFRNGLDVRALSASIQKVRQENSNLDLELESIHNKDGIIVAKVRVPEGSDKAKLYGDLTQTYHQTIETLEERYRVKLEAKDAQIEIYRQQQANLQEIAKLLASERTSHRSEITEAAMEKWVILKVGKGSFSSGFPVTLQIGEEGKLPEIECSAELPPEPNLPESYRQWQSSYRRRTDAFFRIEVDDTQVTNFSVREFLDDCDRTAKIFQNRLNSWLNSEAFRSIKERLLETLNPEQSIRVILQTSNPQLRQIPWYGWDFFDRYPKTEIAIGTPTYERRKPAILPQYQVKTKVKILSILGNSTGINVTRDREILDKLPDADVTFLVEPKRQEFNDRLWEQPWDILFFAGHSNSSTDGKTGNLVINDRDRLTIPQLKYGLRKAIDRGLQLAIFNSCEGLGLAANLADLQIPQIIVMREPVSDRVAQAFLKHFLSAFSSGTPLYLSVREAREKLQGLEDEFPRATWLPVLGQNPAVSPITWKTLTGNRRDR